MALDGGKLNGRSFVEQWTDIYDLMEIVTFLHLNQHKAILQSLISAIRESQDQEGIRDHSTVIMPYIERFKLAVHKFNDTTFVLTCSNFD